MLPPISAVTIDNTRLYQIAKVQNGPEGWTPFFNRQMSQFGTGKTSGSSGRFGLELAVLEAVVGLGKTGPTGAELWLYTASRAATKALLGTCA